MAEKPPKLHSRPGYGGRRPPSDAIRGAHPPPRPVLLLPCERMFVLGIDPGVSRCGFGAVRRVRPGALFEPVRAGVITTPPADPLPERLASLAAELRLLLDELRPDAVVVERVFFQTNV